MDRKPELKIDRQPAHAPPCGLRCGPGVDDTRPIMSGRMDLGCAPKVLKRAGLIARGRDAQWRPCRLEAAAMKDVADWLEPYRRFWTESFDCLDNYLREVKEKEKRHGRKQRRK